MKAQTEKTASITADEAKGIAREHGCSACRWSTSRTQIDSGDAVSEAEGPFAPINQFAHYREFPDASNKSVVGLNVDTLYSLGALDLSQGTDRAVRSGDGRPLLDHAVDRRLEQCAACARLAVTVGSKGGNFAIVGPDWKGTRSRGLTELRMPTNLVMIGGRTYTANKDDYARFMRCRTNTSWCRCRNGASLHAAGQTCRSSRVLTTRRRCRTQVLAMSPETFFNRLNASAGHQSARARRPSHDGADREARHWTGRISSGWHAFSPEVRKAIEDGVAEGKSHARRRSRGKNVNGWDITLDMGRYGTNYPYRAPGRSMASAETYLKTRSIRSPRRTATATAQWREQVHAHFTKDEIPPVNAFWSLTMYDADAYLVPNPINRYALGDRSGMKFGDDGSLTIYIQSESPGTDKESQLAASTKG